MTEPTATPSDRFALPTDADTQRVTVSNWDPEVVPLTNVDALLQATPCVPKNYLYDPAPWVMDSDKPYKFIEQRSAFRLPLDIMKCATWHADDTAQVVLQIKIQPASSLAARPSFTCEVSCTSGNPGRAARSSAKPPKRAISDAKSHHKHGNQGHRLKILPVHDSRSTSTCCQTRKATLQTRPWYSFLEMELSITF